MPIETRRWTNTADSQRWPYAVSCSQVNCYFTVCCGTPGEGEGILARHETEGPCPFDGRGASKGMPVGKSLREMQWDQLDLAVDRAVDPATEPRHKEQAKGEILGIAKCIYLMDLPYWGSPEAVMAEGAERLKMRKGEIAKRATPGCEVSHSVQELGARTRVTKSAPPRTKHPLDVKIEALDDRVASRILKGLRAGMEPEFLADTYTVELTLVKRMAAQPDRFARNGG